MFAMAFTGVMFTEFLEDFSTQFSIFNLHKNHCKSF